MALVVLHNHPGSRWRMRCARSNVFRLVRRAAWNLRARATSNIRSAWPSHGILIISAINGPDFTTVQHWGGGTSGLDLPCWCPPKGLTAYVPSQLRPHFWRLSLCLPRILFNTDFIRGPLLTTKPGNFKVCKSKWHDVLFDVFRWV